MSEEIVAVDRLHEYLAQEWEGDHISCHLIVGPLLSAPGQLFLEDQQLRFKRASGLSGRLAPAKDIVMSLDEITHIQISQGDIGVFTKNEKPCWLRGKLLLHLAAWLYAMGAPSTASEDPWTKQKALGVSTATQVAGMLQRHGIVATGADQIIFLPSSTLDLSLGSWPLRIPVSEVDYVERKAGSYTLRSAQEEWGFLNLRSSVFFTVLTDGLTGRLQNPDGPLETEGTVSSDALLFLRDTITRGTVNFTPDTGKLVFRNSQNKERDLGSLLRTIPLDVQKGDEYSDSFQGRDEPWRLQLPTASPVYRVLLSAYSEMMPPLPPEDQRVQPSKALKVMDALRIDYGDGTSQTHRPVYLEYSESTFDFHIPKGRLDESVTNRVMDFILMGRRVFQLRTMAWRLEDIDLTDLPEERQVEFESVEHIVRLRLPWPSTRQFQESTNRRELYRITFRVGERVLLNIGERKIPVKLINLSAGGIGVESREELALGEEVILSIGIPDQDTDLHTEVVWVSPKRGIFRLGLRFLNNSQTFQQRMMQQMYRLELLTAKRVPHPLASLVSEGSDEQVLDVLDDDSVLEFPTENQPK